MSSLTMASLSDASHTIFTSPPTRIVSPQFGNVTWTVGDVTSANVAVIVRSLSIVTVSGLALPPASPDQLTNTQPGPGVAVSCTVEPSLYEGWFGFFVTVPLPMMLIVSVRWIGEKLATMFLLTSTITLSRVALPLASPLQPSNCQPALACADSVTLLPQSYVA